MSFNKSKGQMYGWVHFVWSILRGACVHRCQYCSVQAMSRRWPAMAKAHTGPLALNEQEFSRNLGGDRTIFVEHLNDLFADAVPEQWIVWVLNHCNRFPTNTYVFQTKNPRRLAAFHSQLPYRFILGTTIESNQWHDCMGEAPHPMDRGYAMIAVAQIARMMQQQSFVTIEPILDFDLTDFVRQLTRIKPSFINIGADSKGGGLPEPTWDKVEALIQNLKHAGIEIREKFNLERLKK